MGQGGREGGVSSTYIGGEQEERKPLVYCHAGGGGGCIEMGLIQKRRQRSSPLLLRGHHLFNSLPR